MKFASAYEGTHIFYYKCARFCMKNNDNSTLGRSLWRLVRFARPHARRIVLGLAANAGARFFDLLPMIVVGRVVDTVAVALREGQALAGGDFVWAGLLVLGTFAGLAVFQSVSDYTLDSAAQRIRHDLRVDLYTHVQKLDVSYFESRQTGDIMAVLAGDVDNLERFFSDTSTSIVRLFITFTGIYGILFWMDYHLALLLLAPMPVAIWAVRFFATRVAPQYRKARKAVGDINAILENNLQGMNVIQAYSAQDHQTGRIRLRSEEYRDAAIRAARERARFVPLLYGVAGLGYALLIGGGGWMTFAGIGPSVGDFTTFVLLAMRLILPLFGIRVSSPSPELLRSHRGLIFPNHVSALDIPALFFFGPKRFLGAAEIEPRLLIGWMARRLGTVFVSRQDRQSRKLARVQVANAHRTADRPPIVLFPEGRLGPGDGIFPFRRGGFEIAMEHGIPYLTVALRYDPVDVALWRAAREREEMWGSLWRLAQHTGTVHVEVIPLSIVHPKPDDDAQALAGAARREIADALGEFGLSHLSVREAKSADGVGDAGRPGHRSKPVR